MDWASKLDHNGWFFRRLSSFDDRHKMFGVTGGPMPTRRLFNIIDHDKCIATIVNENHCALD